MVLLALPHAQTADLLVLLHADMALQLKLVAEEVVHVKVCERGCIHEVLALLRLLEILARAKPHLCRAKNLIIRHSKVKS